jgi:hypothetical protein
MTPSQEKEVPDTLGIGVTDADVPEICVCPHCDKRIRFKPRLAGAKAKCPNCGNSMTLCGTTALGWYESSPPDRFSSMVGWATSIVLHGLLLLSFTGITWYSGFGTGAGERKVGIVIDGEGSIYSSVNSGLALLTPRSLELTGPPLPTPDRNQLIENLGDSGASLMTDVAIEAGSLEGGAAGSVEGDWGSLSSGEGGADGDGANFFGIEARGGKFVYVVDRSGSMMGNRFQDTKAELIRSVQALKQTMEFFIIFYDNDHQPMPANGLIKATGPNKNRYLGWVEAMTCRSGTDPRQAMLLALSLEPDAIWLLSDGQFDVQACDVIRVANPGARIPIHTIAFHSAIGQHVLARIAEENRGHYRFVPPPMVTMPRGFPPPGRRP